MTRGQNILDLVITNDPSLVTKITTEVSTSTSDHNLLEIAINHPYLQPKEERSKERPYSTGLHKYELHKGDAEDWKRYEALMTDVNWNSASRGC